MKSLQMRAGMRGFTLVELAIAVVIIGVLAAFAVPRYMDAVERSKAAEAFNYLNVISGAQERYQAQNGTYSKKISSLDVDLSPPEYFKVGKFVVPKGSKNLETGWQCTLTRTGPSSGYGKYTVTYTHEGFDQKLSTIEDSVNPHSN